MALPPIKPRSWLFDLFGDYVEHRERELWTGKIIALAGEFGLTERAIRSALLRLPRDGWLSVRRAGALSYYGLTDAGRDLIDRGRDRIMRGPEHDWDGRWAVLTYTIPEAHRELRDRLRAELGWLGFGALSAGLFLSPRDHQEEIRGIAARHGLEQNVILFRASQDWPGDDRALAARCWDLQAMNASYAAFIHQFDDFTGKRLNDHECFLVRFRLIGAYRRFPFQDPGLPPELLPGYWQGFKATDLFRHLHARLANGANRYFDEVCATAAAA